MLRAMIAAMLIVQAPAMPPPTAVPRPSLRFDPATVPAPRAVLDVIDYTAAAQIAALRARPVTLTGGTVDQITANWVASTFYTGAARLSRVSNRAGVGRFLREIADHYNFGLRGGASPREMIDADNQAIGALYEEMYARGGQPGVLMPLRQRLDYTLPFLARQPAPARLTWWWCDALFMAPPVYARLSRLTGDRRYLDAMDTQWWRAHERLWSQSDSLYFRDERFPARRSANGAKVFWGRGNGWVIGGLARVLEAMPADYPSRPRYVATFRAMAGRLARLQRTDGMWPTSLLDQQAFPGPESSSSAFFVYAMAWGINHGLLDRRTFLPPVLRGWAGLTGAIQPNGLLGYAQRTGDQPVPATADDTALYATGGLILAGLEVMHLGEPTTPLPVPEPPRDPAIFGLPQPPAMPDRAAPESERRRAEIDAVRSLGFDPAVDR